MSEQEKKISPDADVVKEGLSAIFSSISSSISSENKELYEKLVPDHMKESIESSGWIGKFSPDNFFFSFIYPFDNFIDGMIQSNISKNDDVGFIFRNSQFVDRHFCNLIEKIDGSACSADRSRTIVRSLVNFFSTGKEISFDYSQEYTYHLPETVFRTHQEIIDFYQGIKNVFYGSPDKYLLAMQKIYAGINARKDAE